MNAGTAKTDGRTAGGVWTRLILITLCAAVCGPGVLVSTDASHAYKPDPRAYRLGIERLHLAKHDTLFAALQDGMPRCPLSTMRPGEVWILVVAWRCADPAYSNRQQKMGMRSTHREICQNRVCRSPASSPFSGTRS
jgi:hypothetical protein